MRFRAAHKASSYLMVAAAIGTLAAAGNLTFAQIAACLIVGTLSWFAEPESQLSAWLVRLDLPFKVLVLGYFCITVFSLVQSFPEPDLTALLDLVLVLVGYKLMQRKTNRDYMQLYILAFLLILAASWLAQSALFALGFAVYVVALVWALILFHLRREIEDNYLVKHEASTAAQRVTAARVLDSRRVVGRPFFYATAAAALAVLAGATIVFALAPRIGIGFLTGGVRRHGSVAGFSDQVELGHHGNISSDNQTVILRVGMPRLLDQPSEEARDAVIASLYWRGTVYDTYENGQWLRSRSDLTRTKLSTGFGQGPNQWRWVSGPETPDKPPSRKELLALADRQEIQIMGVSLPVAFALDSPVAFEVEEPATGAFLSTQIEARYSGEAALRTMRTSPYGRALPLADFAGARYVAYSIDSLRRARPGAAKAITELPEGLLAPYLQVPADLRKRLSGLVRRITADHKTPAARAQAVMTWLHRSKTYSLDLKRDPSVKDPLEDFLMVQSSGHCEYFATAAAIMLRIADVPTRYVNGFLGGEWNDLSNLVTVRDNRAHSWTEVYFSGFGWTRMDATPAISRPSRMSRLKQVADSIELWWGQWVIEYDASRQLDLARGLAKSLGFKRQPGSAFSLPKPDKRLVYGVVAFGLAVYVALRIRKRRVKPGQRLVPRAGAQGAVQKLYERSVRAVGSLGVTKQASETPREHLQRACRAESALAKDYGGIVATYEAVRFGTRQLNTAQLNELAHQVTAVEALCKERLQTRKAA
ncbi:MAG: DUF3488 and transglutaminase-like domain-containing protein [Deltaproteobacteria bacterium]|nr:DUF3488 and transglutaminase-like domain-containing protein [Deltaproteobacteria bacterium]